MKLFIATPACRSAEQKQQAGVLVAYTQAEMQREVVSELGPQPVALYAISVTQPLPPGGRAGDLVV
jgi:hypothetical protein